MSPALLAYLTFGAPAMLAGAAMVALPFIAHWMHRRVRTRTVFPSLKLLREAAISREQFGAWRRWLLFLLRAAAVLLAAAAFARPLWSRAPAASADAEGPGVALVLLDASVSMTRRIDGIALFQHAVSATDDILAAAARRGDRVHAIHVGARPEPVFPAVSANAPALRAEVRRLEPDEARADWPAALALAARTLQELTGERRLLIVSDFQAANWQEVVKASASQSFQGVDVTLVAPPDRPTTNAGLHAPGVRPAFPTPGRPARLSVRVVNHSPRPQTLEVALLVDGVPAGHQSAEWAAHEEQEIVFEHAFAETGLARVVFELPADDLTADNRAYLACRVQSRSRVVVVSSDDADVPGTGAYHLVRALAPHDDRRDVFAVQTLQEDELSVSTLSGARAVWLVEASGLDATAVASLQEFADQGGGLLWLTSTLAAAGFAHDLEESWPDGWLPFRPGVAETAPGNQAFRLREDRDAARLLTAFDPAARDALSRTALLRRLGGGQPHPEALTALRFRDGPPALAWRDTAGGGRVLLAAFSPARDAGTLGSAAVWVALCHALMEAMPAPGGRMAETFAGDGLRMIAPEAAVGGGEPLLRCPAGDRLPDATFLLEHTTLTARLPQARSAGFYALVQDGQVLGLEGVNVDPREGDARRVDLDALTAQLQSGRGPAPQHATTVDAAAGLADRTTPLWGWVLAAALLLLTSESLLLSRWRC